MKATKKLKILFLMIVTILSFGFFGRIASAASSSVIVVVIQSAPSTPTGLSSIPESCGYINITWNPSQGATSYTLTDNWVDVYTGATNSFRQAVTPGSPHTYRVIASNSAGSSSYSSPAGAVGPPACGINYTVSTSSTAGGHIDPGYRTVPAGSNTSFSIVAYSGYAIDTASGCGGSLSGSTYTTGAINANCTVYVTFRVASPMTGSISAFPSSCIIYGGNNSCSVTLTWNTENPVGVSSVTASGMTSVFGNSGSQSFFVPYNTRTFYLYNSGQLLDFVTVNSYCETGSAWNGSVCSIPTTFDLTVNKTGYGTVTSNPGGIFCGSVCASNYAPSVNIELTAWPSSGNRFDSWSGACTGGGGCNVFMNSSKNVTAAFSPVLVTVTASTPYHVAPSTTVTFNYNSTSNYDVTECRLLDYSQSPLTSYQYHSSSSINYTVPASPNSYGYYIQCRDRSNPQISALSSLVTVNVVNISVSATTTYNTTPGANVSFAYTASTNAGSTQCALLNNTQTALTSYQSSSPIVYAAPVTSGSYGYYVRCRHAVATSVIATSSLITVNVACSAGTSWNGTSCVPPSGSISSTTCQIQAEGNSCQTSLTWNTWYPIGVSAVTTNPSNTIVTTGNSGSGFSATVPYSSKTFYLYNNSQLLSQTTASAVCATGTAWSVAENKCKATTGTLYAGGCTIGQGESTCQVQLDWTTTNPTTTSVLRKNSTSGDIVRSANNGSELHSVSQGITNFFLLHGGVTLKTAASTAVCASMTQWNGNTCQLLAPEIEDFYSASSTIFNGRSTTLHWASNPSLVDSCVVTAPSYNSGPLGPSNPEGGLVITPTVTTTYTLTCTRGSYSDVDTLVVKVLNMVIKEN